MKKVLIIDNTFDPPHGCPEIRALVEKAAEAYGPVEVSFARAPEGKIPESLEGYDGVVLSGSKTLISESAPWIDAEMNAIKQLHALKIPTLGICYGEQLIARSFGSDTGLAKQYEFGWVEIEHDGKSPILQGLPRKFYSFEFHRDEVRTMPAQFQNTASSENCKVQAFDMNNAPMWGLQFHPERGRDQGRDGLKRVEARGEKVINGDKGDSLFDPAVGETIFRNFLKFVWKKS